MLVWDKAIATIENAIACLQFETYKELKTEDKVYTGDRAIIMSLSRKEIVELQRLCDWLETQPCKSAFSGDVVRALPDCKHWVSHAWKGKRKKARVIYYQVHYGWRVHRFWQRRLDKLALEVS